MLDPVMNAVVKVFCMHSEPSYSQPWQRESQYSSTSSGFALPGQMLLTNAHSVECHSQVRVSVAPGRERRGPGVLGVLDGPGRVGEPVFQLLLILAWSLDRLQVRPGLPRLGATARSLGLGPPLNNSPADWRADLRAGQAGGGLHIKGLQGNGGKESLSCSS